VESNAVALDETLVVGLGNTVLGDDAVGWRVVEEVRERLAGGKQLGSVDSGVGRRPPIRFELLSVGGIALMETLSGCRRAILVDAAEFPGRPVGEIRVCAFEELPAHPGGHLDSIHDASLATALDFGRRLGAPLPDRIDAVTVQIHSTDEFSEQLSPQVAAAVPGAVEAVLRLLTE
jgi:hydrogenase maturation protease